MIRTVNLSHTCPGRYSFVNLFRPIVSVILFVKMPTTALSEGLPVWDSLFMIWTDQGLKPTATDPA